MIISELPPGTAVLPIDDGPSESGWGETESSAWLAETVANAGAADWPQPPPPAK